ncbi:hypothetical protein C0993_000634, partial [Termitomyces sp. T159_Od127]
RCDEEHSMVATEGEAYFGMGNGDDLSAFWEAHSLTILTMEQPHLMAATFPIPPANEPFPFNSPMITATDGTPIPSNYLPASPNPTPLNLLPGDSTLAPATVLMGHESNSDEAALHDSDITMGAKQDFLMDFAI